MDTHDSTIAGNSEKGGSSSKGNPINIDGTPSPSSFAEQGETEIGKNGQHCYEAPKDEGGKRENSDKKGTPGKDNQNNVDGTPRENGDKQGTPGKDNQNNIGGTPCSSSSAEQAEAEIDKNDQHCYEAPKDEGGKSPSSSPEQGETEIDNNGHEAPKARGKTNSDKQGTPGKGNQNNINGTSRQLNSDKGVTDARGNKNNMKKPRQLNSDKRGTPGVGNKSYIEITPSLIPSPKQGETEIDSNRQHCYQGPKDGGERKLNRDKRGTPEQGETKIDNNSHLCHQAPEDEGKVCDRPL